MQTIELGKTGTNISRLIYGCMRLAGDGSREARSRGKRAIRTAIDAGYTAFDHADIYGNGECERVFGEALAATAAQTLSGFQDANKMAAGLKRVLGDGQVAAISLLITFAPLKITPTLSRSSSGSACRSKNCSRPSAARMYFSFPSVR